jgi:hypothetical protein
VLLDVAGSAELVERALGHPGKHVDHRIDPILLGKGQEAGSLMRHSLRAIYTNNENSVAQCRLASLAKLEAILSVVACRWWHKAT